MDDIFDNQLCGKCKHHKIADDGVMICANEDSGWFGCAVNRDCCADYEEERDDYGIKYDIL